MSTQFSDSAHGWKTSPQPQPLALAHRSNGFAAAINTGI
jgi:hypothetical protein